MIPTLRTVGGPVMAALVLAAACADATVTASEDAPAEAPESLAAAAQGPVTAPAADLPAGPRAARARSWGVHGPKEYGTLVGMPTPDGHPGIPFYARVGYPPGFPEGQLFEAAGRVVIVFYRVVSCIPDDFDLLDFFHFPSPDGPGAYQCPAYHTGVLYTEADAPPTAFPKIVDLKGTAVPIWLVDAGQFREAASDGSLTMPELAGLDRIERTVDTYEEHIHARVEDHFLGIDARHDREDPAFHFRLELEGVTTSDADLRLVIR